MNLGTSGRANGMWAVSQQLISVFLSGLFAVILIRSLSVADFGVYSYATAIAGLAITGMIGGLQGLGVREFANRPHDAAVILSAIVLVRESLAIIAYVILLGFTAAFAESGVLMATAVAMLMALARVFDAPELWFQANLQSAKPAIIRIAVALAFFGIRIGILLTKPNYMYLIITLVIEQLVIGALMFRQVRKANRDLHLTRPSGVEARSLLRMSTPVAISSVANQVNLRADLVLIQMLTGNIWTGLYSAATRISEMILAVPVAYMNATFPVLLNVRRTGEDPAAYKAHLQKGFDGTFWFGVVVIAGVWLFGDLAIHVLFGTRYEQAAQVLKIQVLASPFVFMAAVFSKWILAENRLWLSVGRHSAGAVVAVGLNLLLIPRFGIEGSAWATVVSYSISSYLFCFFTRSTWPVAGMMSLAVLAPARIVNRWFRMRPASKRGRPAV